MYAIGQWAPTSYLIEMLCVNNIAIHIKNLNIFEIKMFLYKTLQLV